MQDEWPDRIAETFAQKTLLITGASGFLGKVLIEKLLRCCTQVATIYVILRPKHGKTVRERLDHIIQSPLFDKVKASKGFAIFNKIKPIDGDISQVECGISKKDQEVLCNEVEIVYHCAANVRFEETLRTSVLMNVRGTKWMLALAKRMHKLCVFFHVSTAYCHLHERIIYEKPYEAPADPERIIEIVEKLSEHEISALSHKILDDIPNTYCYTKALAEGLVNRELTRMPIVLLRPSFVIPIWKDPIPGWTDTINGIIGFEIASAKGVLRTMHTDGEHYTDFVPVDVAISAFLFSAFEYLTYQTKLPLEKRYNIHNLTTSSEYKVTWNEIKRIGTKVIERVPLNWVVWYPNTVMTTNKLLYQLLAFFLHLLPACCVDLILLTTGHTPFLLRTHRRLLKGFDMMNYYGRNQWEFRNDWTLKNRHLLNPRERQTYTLFGDGIDYFEYFTHCAYAARRYMLNESDQSIPTAKRHLKMMYYIDIVCKLAISIYFLLFAANSFRLFIFNVSYTKVFN